MWKINKTLDFCYGHRTYTQVLNGEFASDLKTACRHLHGHEGKMVIYLEGDTLDNTGMVTDFRHLEWCKKLINEYVDHQFIIDINDPMFASVAMAPFETLTGSKYNDKFQFLEKRGVAIVVPNTDHIIGYKIDLSDCSPEEQATPEFEVVEGITIVDFVPTSENLSKWATEFVQAKMARLGVRVAQLDWWETPKSCSTYVPSTYSAGNVLGITHPGVTYPASFTASASPAPTTWTVGATGTTSCYPTNPMTSGTVTVNADGTISSINLTNRGY